MSRSTLVGTFVLFLSVPLLAQGPAAAPPAPETGTIDAVTVYRGQAMVTRIVDLPAGGGPRELVVTGLPEALVMGSLHAEPAAEGVSVRSVTYRIRPVSADVREGVRKLDADILTAQDAMNANARQTQLVGERKNYLGQLEQFSAPTATAELKAGVLNAETLKALTLFVFDERQKIATEELRLATERREIVAKLGLLQRQRNELAGGSARSLREAVIFADARQGGRIRLRYLVNGATWSPSYNVRAGEDRKAVTVECNAAVEQMSGEDWSNVAMTLSTATPSLVAAAPRLDPLAIVLVEAAEPSDASRDVPYGQKRQALIERRKGVESSRNNFDINIGIQASAANASINRGAPATQPQQQQAQQMDADGELNRLASELQRLEFVAKDAGDRHTGWGPKGIADEQSVSVTYDLPGRTSLPSRSDRQLIQIASGPMDARFYKLAVPVLTSSVYEQAALTNSGKTVLLSGPVSSYVGGQFVGAGQIPTVAVGETFSVGFGIDSSLRASRELLDKTESVQGGNKVLDFNYRLSVENFGSAPANVRLVDRIPTSKDPSVKITQVSATVEASRDETYTDAERKQGLLRWDVEVAPAATAAKALVVTHKYRIEHDRQMTIGGLAAGN
ncbi:MAG TPA: mucoidy inhibitor MuiA family protein [Tepidisphaeraceae bacterium]|jgi:hypothetical protein